MNTTFKDAAIQVLKKAKKPLHYKEITRLALEESLFETHGSTPEATMNAQIIMDIKNRKDKSDFIKTAPSTYTLNPNRKEDVIPPKVEENEKIEAERVVIESGFVGRAGEHLVCSELLFRGFNASIMSVDTGLDIVAVKDNKLYGIQVKTSNLNSFNYYVYDVRRVSFERHSSNNIFYIFVLHEEGKNHFLILPYYEMEKKMHEGAILEVNKGKAYRINLKVRNDTVYLGRKEHDVRYFLNNWDIIK